MTHLINILKKHCTHTHMKYLQNRTRKHYSNEYESPSFVNPLHAFIKLLCYGFRGFFYPLMCLHVLHKIFTFWLSQTLDRYPLWYQQEASCSSNVCTFILPLFNWVLQFKLTIYIRHAYLASGIFNWVTPSRWSITILMEHIE